MRLWSREKTSPVYRALGSGDGHAAAQLHVQGFERGWSALEFDQLIADQSVLGFMALERGRPSGFVIARLALDEAEILSVVVGVAARRKGIGAGLVSHLSSSLAQRGVTSLFLEVEEENTAALALYRRFGFDTVGKRKSYYKRADGSNPSALVMRLTLGG